MVAKQALLEKLISDLKSLKQPEGYLVASGRDFHWLFGRDSLITSLMLLPMGGGPQITKDTLLALARLQGTKTWWRSEEEPGKIIHEYRNTEELQKQIPQWDFPYYGSIDATPLFIIVAREYARITGDWKFIKDIWENLKAAANWIENYGDRDKDLFVESQKLNPQGIHYQNWKDHTSFCGHPIDPVAIVDVQGYAHKAYRSISLMATRLADYEVAEHYRDLAKKLQVKFNQCFWVPDDKFFALGLDGNKEPVRSVASNQGQLLFTRIIMGARKRKAIVERLALPDMWTPYGIRTLSDQEPCFNPYLYHLGSIWLHDNWMIYYGLRQFPEFREQAQALKEIMINTACILGGAPELHACENGELKVTDNASGWGTKPADPIQAWSAAAIINLLCEDFSPREKAKIII